MNPAFVVRFKPLGPWRIGPKAGARDRVDRVFHSDALFSAVSVAMLHLDRLDAWLDATVRHTGGARVLFSSCFPYLEETHFITPPRTLWPPAPSPKVRWSKAEFVPLQCVQDLIAERPLPDGSWYVDGPSGCLLPEESGFHSGPFRVVSRSHAAVDRVHYGSVEVHRTACLEFAPGGGLWSVVSFADEAARDEWAGTVQGALRLLADTGLGGERSLGWGRSADPEFFEGTLPDLILPEPAHPAASPLGEEAQPAPPETVYWLLSLFSPGGDDTVDWRRGSYTLVERAGRVDRSGGLKKLVRMVEEGSVVVAASAPRGAAPDVAPDGFPHPVYRAGYALSIPIPLRQPERSMSTL